MQFFTERIEGSRQAIKTRSLKYRAFGTKTKDSERSYRKYKRKVGYAERSGKTGTGTV